MSLCLVVNCGSSSLKFAVLNPIDGNLIASGLAERLSESTPTLTVRFGDSKTEQSLGQKGHLYALEQILSLLKQQEIFHNIELVGHRVVHGGEKFKSASRINEEVLAQIEACVPLAPLHNPANLIGIRAALAALPNLPQVAVFDTAFHQTLPDYAYRYAVATEWYEKAGVRRYGFHGTSHQFVAQRAAELLNLDPSQANFVTAHLGNGCSVAAVKDGLSVDTSMGMTPLEGLVMGTRSGDVDPNLLLYVANHFDISIDEVTDRLNKKSGLLGVSGLSNDMRELEIAAKEGDVKAGLAIEIFCYRLAKYIAAMAVPLGRINALVFTGGIGENSVQVRAKTLEHLKILGFEADESANTQNTRGKEGVITSPSSAVAVVVSTNEELMIARQTYAVIQEEVVGRIL